MSKQFNEKELFNGEQPNIIQKHLVPTERPTFEPNSLAMLSPAMLVGETALEKAGGDVMLQNVANGVKLQLNLDLERELYGGFRYEAGEVWSKVAPKEKEEGEVSEEGVADGGEAGGDDDSLDQFEKEDLEGQGELGEEELGE